MTIPEYTELLLEDTQKVNILNMHALFSLVFLPFRKLGILLFIDYLRICIYYIFFHMKLMD